MTTSTPVPGTAFTERTVEADGFTIKYFQAGVGDPVVYIHGGYGPRFSLALDSLADRFRVILLEIPGFGDQPNDRHQTFADLAATIDAATRALGLDAYRLVGTSFGGAVALHVALDYPERVTALVLEAPAVFREGENAAPGMSLEEMRGRLRRYPERVPAFEPPDPAMMGRAWPMAMRLLEAADEEQIAARLPQCPVRTLVVFGDDDGILPPQNGRKLARLMPNGTYVLLDEAAHDIQGDRPEAFAELAGDFLTGGLAAPLPEQAL